MSQFEQESALTASTSGLPPPGTRLTWQVLQAYYPERRVGTHVRPLPDHDIVYVKNPKAGCSTLLVWLDRIHTGDLSHEFRNVHKHHRLPGIGDVGRRKTLRMLRGGAYRFSFVRDPVRRFESIYWDKIARGNKWRPQTQATLGIPRDTSEIPTFEEFLLAVEQQDPLAQMDPHWRPQHINLLHPVVTLSFVGRLENFDADLARIREEAGLPDVPHQVRNRSRHTGHASVYDGRPDLRRRVEELYATDMELYGY